MGQKGQKKSPRGKKTGGGECGFGGGGKNGNALFNDLQNAQNARQRRGGRQARLAAGKGASSQEWGKEGGRKEAARRRGGKLLPRGDWLAGRLSRRKCALHFCSSFWIARIVTQKNKKATPRQHFLAAAAPYPAAAAVALRARLCYTLCQTAMTNFSLLSSLPLFLRLPLLRR